MYDAEHDGRLGYPVGDVEHSAIPQGRSPTPSGRDTEQNGSAARKDAFTRIWFGGMDG